MTVVDAAEAGPALVLPPPPQLIDPHSPLTAYSSYTTALLSLSKRSSSRSRLVSLLAAGGLSAVYPLLLHSFARLLHQPVPLDDGEVRVAQQLWRTVRNLITVRATQCPFIESVAFPALVARSLVSQLVLCGPARPAGGAAGGGLSAAGQHRSE